MMRRLGTTAALVLALAGFGACSRGTAADCDRGCRNYYSLHFWDRADKELAAAPAGERDALRAKKLEELDSKLKSGDLNMCVSQCQKAATNEQVACMIGARTMAESEACVGPGGQD